MKIFLGSASPRRKMILCEIFGDIQTVAPSVDERRINKEPPEAYIERITMMKMDEVLRYIDKINDAVIITADTIVTIDGNILGKPGSEDEAFAMLRVLSGKEHSVVTGLCFTVVRGGKRERFFNSEKTVVKFKKNDNNIISEYLGSVDYKDKAGSYAIQERGELIVESVTGSITNVIGLPLRLFYRMLSDSGIVELII